MPPNIFINAVIFLSVIFSFSFGHGLYRSVCVNMWGHPELTIQYLDSDSLARIKQHSYTRDCVYRYAT